MVALSGSARARKCQLKKKGLSDPEIWEYLAREGFIPTQSATPIASQRNKPTIINTPPPGDPLVASQGGGPITLDLIEAYISRGLQGADVDASLIAQAFKLIDMKEKHSDNSVVVDAEKTKFEEVRQSVFSKLRSAPCDHPPTTP